MTSVVGGIIHEAKICRGDYLLAVRELPREVSGKLALKRRLCLWVGGHNEEETFSVDGTPFRISDEYRALEIGGCFSDTGLTER